jgi:hypothetical protein
MEETEFLNKEIKRYLKALQDLKIDEPKTIAIDSAFFSKELDDANETKKKSFIVQDIFVENKNSPVLYWFSFDNDFNQQCEVREHFKQFSSDNSKMEYKKGEEHFLNNKLINRRAFSACKSKHDLNTKTLYVGKVEKNIWGRLAVHAGWGSSPKTAGMQLRFWYDFKKYGNLTFNYIVLHNDLKYFVEVLEKELRNELNPLIGKK